MEKSKITQEMRVALRLPFPSEAYSKHPTKTFLTTLKAMYITERLNDVLGIGRWSIEHEVIERSADYVLIQGTLISLDYEIITPSQYGGHKTTGKNTEIADGYKSAITDCISKIASYLEIGIDMFKGKVNTPNGGNTKTQSQETNKRWLNDKDIEQSIKWLKSNNKQPKDLYTHYSISKTVFAKIETEFKK